MDKRINTVLGLMIGGAIGTVISLKAIQKKLIQEKNKSYKYLALYALMNQWIKLKQDGKNLSIFFEKRGYHRIAIYGMGYAGTTLVDELKKTCTETAYAIDKNASNLTSAVKIVTLEDPLETVDAIVVTPISLYDEIKKDLQSYGVKCPIISLEEIVFSL